MRKIKSTNQCLLIHFTHPSLTISTSAFLDPDIVEGLRKHRPIEQILKNGDSFSNKRSKTSNKSSVDQCASIEDVEELAPPLCSCPRNPTRILEHSDGSDNAANVSK